MSAQLARMVSSQPGDDDVASEPSPARPRILVADDEQHRVAGAPARCRDRRSGVRIGSHGGGIVPVPPSGPVRRGEYRSRPARVGVQNG